MHLADAIAVVNNPHGIDRRKAAKGLFELSEVHDYLA